MSFPQQGCQDLTAAPIPLIPHPCCWSYDKTITEEPVQESPVSPPELYETHSETKRY